MRAERALPGLLLAASLGALTLCAGHTRPTRDVTSTPLPLPRPLVPQPPPVPVPQANARDCGDVGSLDSDRIPRAHVVAACLADAIAKQEPFVLRIGFSDGYVGTGYRVLGKTERDRYQLYSIETHSSDVVDPRHPSIPIVHRCGEVTMTVAPREDPTWRAEHSRRWVNAWATLRCD